MATENQESFYEDFYQAFLTRASELYPKAAASISFREKISRNLISPHITELPSVLRYQAQAIVEAFFALRQSNAWQARLGKMAPAVVDPGHTSVLMSYDFHVDADGQLRLIEINTNASLSLMVDVAHEVHGVANPFSDDFRKDILDCFDREHREACGGRQLNTIAIVDEKPESQRLFSEFKMFQDLFASRGWRAEFYDPSELHFSNHELRTGSVESTESVKIDLVYNRDTDFYFTKDSSRALREAMEQKAACITPHPYEYRLLADKERLLELSNPMLLEAAEISEADKATIRKTLIRTIDIKALAPDEFWAQRKKWFFKPRNSHGGKAVYRGSSTSKTTFQHILAGDYLAQEMVPPALLKFKNEPEEFKSDLRFYVYRNQIQMACARLYRGQMTNAQTPGGGVSVINWT